MAHHTSPREPMKARGLTHQGLVRKNNEDRFLVRELSAGAVLLAVADGMGGEAGGETAARMVIDAVAKFSPPYRRLPSSDALRQLLVKTNQEIMNEAAGNPALFGMGTTATIAWVDGSTVLWCHVGDSRLYHLHGGKLLQITKDHNLAGLMVERGEFTPEQAAASPLRNVLQRVVGSNNCRPDTGQFDLGEADLLLLCTDGLSGLVDNRRIAELLADPKTSLEEKAQALIEAALVAGGTDNVTVIVAAL